jgi:hypothetical protein
MWHALKTELTYFRPWLLGGLGIAAGVSLLLAFLIRLYGDEGPPIFVVAMFPILAGMVVSFIAQSYRVEERRSRLLMAGPSTPSDLAAVMVLLPVCLVVLSTLAAIPVIGLTLFVTGRPGAVAPQLFYAGLPVEFMAYALMGPFAQEAATARREGRNRAAIAGWAVFAVAVALLAIGQFLRGSQIGLVGQLVAMVAAIGGAWSLYQGRTDFTR